MIDFSDIDLNKIEIDSHTPEDGHVTVSVDADGLGTFALRWRRTDAFKAWLSLDDVDDEGPALPDDVVVARDHIDLVLQRLYEKLRRELRIEGKEHECADRKGQTHYPDPKGRARDREWCRVDELEESHPLGNRCTVLYAHVPETTARAWVWRVRRWLAEIDAELSA